MLDRFRDRLMFPVHDPAGEHVVAFLGRALDPTGDTPKYLNSPATALYCKGEVLYGLGAQPTRQALAAGARPVLVEGALDAIAVTTTGVGRHVGVAPSGTALTAGQVTALDRATGPLAGRGVTVAFDSDPASRQAALRAYPLLRATATEVVVHQRRQVAQLHLEPEPVVVGGGPELADGIEVDYSVCHAVRPQPLGDPFGRRGLS